MSHGKASYNDAFMRGVSSRATTSSSSRSNSGSVRASYWFPDANKDAPCISEEHHTHDILGIQL